MYNTEDSDLCFYGKYCTYKIQRGDTLQSVAQELGIDGRELRRYHNMHCKIADLIETDFKRYSKFLILAEEKSDASRTDISDKKYRKVNLGKNYKLPFLPEHTDKSYKVKYTSEVENVINDIELKIDVKWIAADINKYHLFQINRASDIYINGRIPKTMMDGLAAKTAEILYPLKIVVDKFGKWIDIYNYNEIESRWKKIKSEILDYYESEVVEAYIKHTEYTLKNSERLLVSLRSDYFLRTFFNGIHVEYTAHYGCQNEFLFPLEKETESVFSGQHKMSPNLDEAGFIKIEQKGHYVNSGFGFINGYAFLKVNYKAVYFLNSNNFTIKQINLECNIESAKPIKTSIVIELFDSEKGGK